jgi:hypothetical protein
MARRRPTYVPPTPTPTPAPVPAPTTLTQVNPKSGAQYIGSHFVGKGSSTGYNLNCIGEVDNLLLQSVLMEQAHYGISAGKDGDHRGWQADGLTIHDCEEPLYFARMIDAEWNSLDLQAPNMNNNQWHGVYAEGRCQRVAFRTLKIRGGSGYCFQAYAPNVDSDTLIVEDYDFDATAGRYPIVLWGWSNVIFRRGVIKMTRTDGCCVTIHQSCKVVTFDGFEAEGGKALVGPMNSGKYATEVVFRNGTYKGPTLGTGATFENVTRI